MMIHCFQEAVLALWAPDHAHLQDGCIDIWTQYYGCNNYITNLTLSVL